MEQTIAKELNSSQKKAVFHVEGPMLVLAGAGSGKTRIVTQRILYLLSMGVPAGEILAMTFTNKAAEEMKKRVLQLAKVYVLTTTFHSLCARILRESISVLGYGKDFLILDEEDSEKTLRQCFESLGIKEDKNLVKNTRNQISQAKNNLLLPEDLTKEAEGLKEIYALYQSRLKQYNALDFDDLLLQTVDLFKKHPNVLSLYQERWKFILIDEYQDTNQAQYQLTKLLSSPHRNVFAVGDPDQSIYSWRGANIQNILHFEQDYPGAEVVKLEENYRSSNTILKAANALIQKNLHRYEKNLWSQRGEGEKIGLFIAENERQEAEFVIQTLVKYHLQKNIPYQDCAIFYRTNFQSRTFEDALLKENIPYQIIGGLSFYQRREIKDALSLLRMILSDSDLIAFTRTLNLPKRGLGAAAIDSIKETMQQTGMELFPLCQKIIQRSIQIKLSIRQLQGLEEYVKCIETLRQMHHAQRPVHEILSAALERSRYFDFLKEDPETHQERKQNLEELVAKALEWEQEVDTPSLSSFLEELALKPSSEGQAQEQAVKLMTLHNGKGLEFPLVFLVGMEEDLFPHVNSKETDKELEEERRLCYVGLTRAKDHLYLSCARYRFLWGVPRTMRPSRFLKEVPSEYMQVLSKTSSSVKETREPSSSFQKGDYVFHKDFGAGIVHKAYQTSLGLTYDVFFSKTNELKSLVAKYAKLTQ